MDFCTCQWALFFFIIDFDAQIVPDLNHGNLIQVSSVSFDMSPSFILELNIISLLMSLPCCNASGVIHFSKEL